MSSPPSCSSFYDILGVSPSASPTTIKRAYQQAALATHPDKAPSIQQPAGPTAAMDSDTPTSSASSFHDVQAAWDTLKTPQTRKAYDEQLRRQEREEQGGGFIAEEVRIDEMEDEDGREDGEEGWVVYPCRCGEGFRVRKEEVEGRAGGVVVSCDGCSLRIRVHR